MQSEHLANFKRLAAENLLLTAGPMDDPEKKFRGIVVVRAKNKTEIDEMFKADPYVQSGYLKVEPIPMTLPYCAINTRITPQGLDEFRIVVLMRASDAAPLDQATTTKTSDYIKGLAKREELRLAVAFDDENSQTYHGTTALTQVKCAFDANHQFHHQFQ